jgi:hypothetical protein
MNNYAALQHNDTDYLSTSPHHEAHDYIGELIFATQHPWISLTPVTPNCNASQSYSNIDICQVSTDPRSCIPIECRYRHMAKLVSNAQLSIVHIKLTAHEFGCPHASTFRLVTIIIRSWILRSLPFEVRLLV